MKKGFFIFLLQGAILLAQETPAQDSLQLDEVVVNALAPVTKTELTQNFIQENNFAQDFTYLLQQTPSTVVTSDAGNGVGYTGIRLRGSDASRVLVNIDGVPINDSESQTVFWVDIPDVASSTYKVIIQRGVGYSSAGTSNFGGSINIETQDFSEKPSFRLQSLVGTYSTYKNTLVAQSGNCAKDKLNLRLRLSQVHSDGYVNRASSDLWGYQLQGKYQFSDKSSLKFTYLGGKEKTYQAWYGVDQNTLENDRRFNFAGAIYNSDYSEIIGFYPNQIDNYKQDHLFVKWEQKLNAYSQLKTNGFFTYGRGFYEELAQFQNPGNYKISDDITTDLVRRKWLKNYFYGLTSNFHYSKNQFKFHGNISISQYIGNHFGQVIPSQYFEIPKTVEYYRNRSKKNDYSFFGKGIYTFQNLRAYIDFQLRAVDYRAKTPISGQTVIDDNPDFHKKYVFPNPKIGFDYKINGYSIYGLLGISHREPTRTDILENSFIEPESLNDFELGFNKNFRPIQIEANLYYMLYRNQLVLTGQLDDVGNPIRENSGKSYRFGIESSLTWNINPHWSINGNLNWSQNKNKEFKIKEAAIVENLGNTSLAYSPEWIGFFGLKWKNDRFNISCNNKFVSQQYLDNTENKDLSLDGYFTTQLLLNTSFNFPKLEYFQINAQLNNIFNQLYENNGYVYDGEPYYYPQAPFNFIIGVQLGL